MNVLQRYGITVMLFGLGIAYWALIAYVFGALVATVASLVTAGIALFALGRFAA